MRAAQGNAAVADFMPIFWAFGGEMFDQSGRPSVNSAEGVEALKFMLELGKYSPPGYASFNADEVGALLLQGSTAMSTGSSPFRESQRILTRQWTSCYGRRMLSR
jgi:multiple sugar transport system substrate-binding protein